MKRFEGKRVWVTGASSGIGEAIASILLGSGATVVASSNEEARLSEIRDSLSPEEALRYIPAPFDLEQSDGMADIVSEVTDSTGAIDLLICVGGISQRSAITETPLWLDRKIMEINYFGTIALCKALLPHMRRAGGGHIVVTSSIAGRFGFPLRSAYSASKQALHGFIETLHLENINYNIRGTVVIPGRVKTNISLNALDGKGQPHGKMDRGQEMAMTPSGAARIILKGILRNRREIVVGGREIMLLRIRRYIPWLFFRIAGKIDTT